MYIWIQGELNNSGRRDFFFTLHHAYASDVLSKDWLCASDEQYKRSRLPETAVFQCKLNNRSNSNSSKSSSSTSTTAMFGRIRSISSNNKVYCVWYSLQLPRGMRVTLFCRLFLLCWDCNMNKSGEFCWLMQREEILTANLEGRKILMGLLTNVMKWFIYFQKLLVVCSLSSSVNHAAFICGAKKLVTFWFFFSIICVISVNI